MREEDHSKSNKVANREGKNEAKGGPIHAQHTHTHTNALASRTAPAAMCVARTAFRSIAVNAIARVRARARAARALPVAVRAVTREDHAVIQRLRSRRQ